MKKFASALLLVAVVSVTCYAQQITAPGVKWEDAYSFDRFTEMKVDFFGKGGKLIRTLNYKTYYKNGETKTRSTDDGLQIPLGNFVVCMDAPQKGSDMETIFDMNHEVAIQIIGSDSDEPYYNAGRFRFPEGADIKMLELVPTDETGVIAGYTCKKYTYTYKKIFGSAWITTGVDLPNDYGIFRAAKMASLHNRLSGEGFIMEMTSEDAKGGKTVMTTVSLENKGSKSISLPRSKMGTAINKVSYFTF